MKNRFRGVHRSNHGSLNELNITPLLDLVFVLLVIFIITTPQLTNSLEINLPSGKPPQSRVNTPKPQVQRIFVDDRGQVFLNQQPVSLAGLKQTLLHAKAAEPNPPVVVEGADEADYQNVINVLDLLQQMEITKVGLATEVARP